MSAQQITDFIKANPWVLVVISLWTLFWKGRALWKASSNKHLTWFVLLLLVNTVGILEIGYIYYLSKYELGSSKLLAQINSLFQKK